MAALDPPVDPSAPSQLTATQATHASVRVSAVDDDVVVTVFTSRNSVIAYRLRLDGGAFVQTWRTLVEPSVGLTPFLPMRGAGISDADVIVTKLDVSGRRQWSRVVGTEFEDEP